MLVVVGLVAGVVTGFFAGAAERGLYASGLWSRNGASTITPGTFDQPAASPAATPSARVSASELPAPVLAAASAGRVPSAAKVAARIAAVDDDAMGGSYSAQVADLGTGKVLYAHRAGSPLIPASTMKLLTSGAALSLLGPDHEFTTTVVRAGGTIVLVGGGDPYLARRSSKSTPQRASIATLAAKTAAELRRTKATRVVLNYDASLFSGPAWHPRWPDSYRDQVTPVSALWVDEGRLAGGSPGPRVTNPAREAAKAFAAELKKKGITVTSVAGARPPRSAKAIATVQSMPLEQIVEELLLASDNDAAEVVFRHAAIAAGRTGTFADGVRAVRAELAKLGVWDEDARLTDGSGLARQTKVPAAVLVKLLRTTASRKHPELRAVLTGLPVAGVEGSLRIRYVDAESRAGRGVVRGKTGTLSKVHSLAGYLRTADGSQVAYAFVVNDADNEWAARVWLERVTAALSRCGC